jgi:type IV secretion system protein VirB10
MNLFKLRREGLDEEGANSIEGERALTSVNRGVTLQSRLTNWAVIAALCALTGFLLYKYYAGLYRNYQAKTAPTRDVTHAVATTSLPPLTLPDIEPAQTVTPTSAPDKLPPLREAAAQSAAATAATAGQPQVKSAEELLRDRRLKRDLRFSLDEGSNAGATRSAAADSGPRELQAPPTGTAGQVTTVPQQAGFTAARAYVVPDPTLIMTRGAVIPCTVLPAIDTTVAGIVTCVTAVDATGADNKVSLMDRGTICVGEQDGGVAQGQRRVGIVWKRCETPQHVLVPLESTATDALGRPAIPGQVDNHFWDRFGAAIALSLISDVGPYLIATRRGGGNNNTTVAFPNVLNGPQSVMSEVLKSTMDIRPTITAPQAARVLIYLAGDIDFRDVYKLERSR